MAKLPPQNLLQPGRGVSLPGLGYSRWMNGKLYWSKWPRRQPTPRTQGEAENRKVLAMAATASLYMSANEIAFARSLSNASKLLPRDFLMISLFGRIGTVVRRDGSKIYSMAAIQDVSDLLDAIGQTNGVLLLRGPDRWQALFPGSPFDVLSVNGEGLPEWSPAGGGGAAGQPFMAPPLLKPTIGGTTIGPDTFIGLPILPTVTMDINGIDIWCSSPGSGRHLVAGVYSSVNWEMTGGTLLSQSGVIPATSGLIHLPLNAPAHLTAGEFYYFGIAVINGSGNFQAMTADVVRNSYMFFAQSTADLPLVAPTSTAGTGATQFTWWGF